jgi:hypothetical protein
VLPTIGVGFGSLRFDIFGVRELRVLKNRKREDQNFEKQ